MCTGIGQTLFAEFFSNGYCKQFWTALVRAGTACGAGAILTKNPPTIDLRNAFNACAFGTVLLVVLNYMMGLLNGYALAPVLC